MAIAWLAVVPFITACAQTERRPETPCTAQPLESASPSFRESNAELSSGERASSTLEGLLERPIAWTALPKGTVTKIAVGSCSEQYRKQPIWDEIAEAQPDLFLHLGDSVYLDRVPARGPFPQGLSLVHKAPFDFALWASMEPFRNFAESVPMMLVWDDHDMGKNDGGADFLLRPQMEKLFLDFTGAPQDDPRRAREGLYQARVFGPVGRRVQVILLDTRSFRSALVVDERSREEKDRLEIIGEYLPNESPEARLLGEEQWGFLEEQLAVPAELRLIGSSIQVVANEKGNESWGNFPKERQRLFRLIEDQRAGGVVFLSGDVHHAELSRTDEGPYPLYDFTSSNLNQGQSNWGARFKNSFRVKGIYGGENFGVIRITWEQADATVNLSAHDIEGNAVFEHTMELHELSL